MRILYAHCFYRLEGGEDRHVRDQVDLVSRAHDVELVSEANAELTERPATAVRMLYSRAKKEEVGAIMDRFRPDVVHVHNMYPALGPAVILAARERDVPVVMTVHNFRLRCPNGLMFTEDRVCRRCESGMYVNAVVHKCFTTKKQAGAYAGILWAHRFLMRLEQRIAGFIAPSDFMRSRLLEWEIDNERIHLIRHFVPSAGDARTTDEIGSFGVFFGRLSAEKGVDVLLAALRRASDPPFVIVGDGPHRKALEGLTGRLSLANTKFLGWRRPDEVREVMRVSRYVVLPSVCEESASLAALEALAAARPLLVADRGGLPELVAGGSGLVVRPGDEVGLAGGIRLLMEDDELCRRASSEASRFARRWLDPARHLAELESLYRRLSGRKVA